MIKFALLVAFLVAAAAAQEFCDTGLTCSQPPAPQPSANPTPPASMAPTVAPEARFQILTITYRCRNQPGQSDSFCPEDATCDYLADTFGTEWMACNEDSDVDHFDDSGNSFKMVLYALRGGDAGQQTDAQAEALQTAYQTNPNCTNAECTVQLATDRPFSDLVTPAPSASPTPSTLPTCERTCTAPSPGCRKIKVVELNDGEQCPSFGACAETDGTVTRYVCKDTSRCSINGDAECGICVARQVAAIGEPCDDDTICREDRYDVECLDDRSNPVCGNEDVLAPGQACTPGNNPLFDGDGCAHGDCLSYADAAKCPSGDCCEFQNTGEDCDDDDECKPTDYCDNKLVGSSDQCQPRLGEGADCRVNRDCTYGFFCHEEGVEDRCREWFSMVAGAECDADSECEKGLCCNREFGGEFCRAPIVDEGTACSGFDDDTTCGPCGACVCDSEKGEFHCAIGGVFKQGEIDNINSMINCAERNQCDEVTLFGENDVEYFPEGGCMADHCKSATDEVAKDFGINGAVQSSAPVVAAAVTLLLTAVALVL